MSQFLSYQERQQSIQINLSAWSWDISPYFTLEREDMEVLIPVLEHHVITHELSDLTIIVDKFIVNLKDSLANSHCNSNKIDESTGEMLQIVLGDFL